MITQFVLEGVVVTAELMQSPFFVRPFLCLSPIPVMIERATFTYRFLGLLFPLFFSFTSLESTPSSVFWTYCTTDVYSTGTGHIDADNYFTVFNERGHGSSFSPDIGFEFGAFSWDDLAFETGIDYLGGADNPLYFNAGAAVEEDKLFCHAPSFKVGIFNVGIQYQGGGRTNQNIVDIIAGKSLPDWLGGKFYVGGFSGTRAIGKNRQGFMVAYTRSFCPAKYCGDKDYYKWVFCADYASGKNTIGGGGFGLYYYFTPDISILTGPVWFNSAKINGNWKWSVQIDISFSIFEKKKALEDKPEKPTESPSNKKDEPANNGSGRGFGCQKTAS